MQRIGFAPPTRRALQQAAKGNALFTDDLQRIKQALQEHGGSRARQAIEIIDRGRVSGHPYITAAARDLLLMPETDQYARDLRAYDDARIGASGGQTFVEEDDK